MPHGDRFQPSRGRLTPEAIRRIQAEGVRRRLAEAGQVAAQRQQQEIQARSQVPVPVPQAPPPSQPSIWGRPIPGVLQNLGKLALAAAPGGGAVRQIPQALSILEQYNQAVVQPIAGAAESLVADTPFAARAIPGVGPIISTAAPLGGGEGRRERGERGRTALRGLVTGEQGIRETAGQLGDIQRERGGLQQVITEAVFDPSNIIPVGLIGRGGAMAVRAARSAVGRTAPRLSEPAEILARLQTPGLFQPLIEKGRQNPATASMLRFVSDTALADPDSVIHNAVGVSAVYNEQSADIVGMLMRETNVRGDVKQIFGFDEFGVISDPSTQGLLGRTFRPRTALPGTEEIPATVLGGVPTQAKTSIVGRTFQEIAQHPEQFAVTPEQRSVLDNINGIIERNEAYLVDIGAEIDDVAARKVPGRFFPDFWQYLGDIALERRGISSGLGKNPFYRQSRLHMEASEAVERGYRGNPLEGLEILFRSQYKRARDVKVAQIVKGQGYTQLDRMKFFDAALLQESANVARVNAGAKLMHRIVFDFTSGTAPAAARLGRMRTTPGAVAAREAFPLIMEDLERVVLTGTPDSFRRARRSLREQATGLRDNSLKAFNDVKGEVRTLRSRTRYRQDLGEKMFPGTAVSGRIFTPAERAADIFHSFPEAQLSDLNTIPLDQMDDLARVVEGTPPGGTLYSIARAGGQISGAMRTAVAALDLGVGAIHGAPLLATNPAAWVRIQKLSLQAVTDKRVFATFLEDHWETVQALLDQNQLHGAGSEFVESLRQGGLINRTLKGAESIPGLGRGSRAAQTTFNSVEEQFNVFLMAAKVHFYEALLPMARRSTSPRAMEELADATAKLTGTVSMANLGINPTATQLMGAFLLFAPRYTLATTGLLLDVFRGGLRGDIARKMVGQMMAGGFTMYAAVATRLGQPLRLDPTRSDFMTIDVGNTKIGIGTKYVQLARYAMGFLKQAITHPSQSVRLDTRDNVLNRAFRSNLSPISGLGWDVATGRNYIGDDVTGGNFFKQQLPNSLLPFWLSGQFDTPRAGWTGAVGEFGGLRTYERNLYDRAVQLADIEAHKRGDLDYKDMRRADQQTLLRDNPDIATLFDENNRLWGKRGREVNQYREELRKIRVESDERLNDALKLFELNHDGKAFRDAYSELSALKRHDYDQLSIEFDDVIQMLDERPQDPQAHIEDIAYEEYIIKVVLGDFTAEDGQFDFKMRDEAIVGIRQKYGDPIWNYIQQRRSVTTPTVLQELFDGREQLTPYWGAGELILQEANMMELLPELEKYLKANDDDKRDILDQTPMLRNVIVATTRVRQGLREENEALDHFLFRWGYGGVLHNQTNIDADRDELLRTPVVFR